MIINLNSQKDFLLVQERKITVSSIIVNEIIDMPIAKKVIARVKLGNSSSSKNLILWEGADYDAIGQWTDSDAIAKIKFICENQ